MSDRSIEERYADYVDSRGVLLNAAAQRIPLVSLGAQARALHLWRHNRVEPGNEGQLACVLDLGVFSPVGDHKPALQRLVAAGTPPPGSADEAMLDAFKLARFSLFRVGEPDPRGGLRLFDLCTNEDIWLMDSSLAQQNAAGALIATRLAWPDAFAVTCGALCLMDVRVLLHVMEGRPPQDGPIPPFIEPRIDEPLVAQLLEEAAAPARLVELGQDPLLAAKTYRAALDLGLMGPIPGRTPQG